MRSLFHTHKFIRSQTTLCRVEKTNLYCHKKLASSAHFLNKKMRGSNVAEITVQLSYFRICNLSMSERENSYTGVYAPFKSS